jgi:N-acetyl-alpha-D-glucosaminyl L-malate synthase BshA
MAADGPLRIGITCYPSVGGSGVLATALGEDLAARGHEVHFISYERPFRLPADGPRLHFHSVVINDYGLFRFPDYTLPLSVRMAEVSRDYRLDVLHVHYAMPHATAAILARSMLPPEQQPRVVTTLHGTDTTLLGYDAGYAPAIKHALTCSDAVTAVSEALKSETRRALSFDGPIESSSSTPPIFVRVSASISCWRPSPASARATPSSSSFSRGNLSRRSPNTCGGSAWLTE